MAALSRRALAVRPWLAVLRLHTATVTRPTPRFCAPRCITLRAAPLHTARRLGFPDDIVVTMPQVAESIREGQISTFEKGVGDAVREDDTVLIVDTDKTSVPVPSPAAGTIQEFFVKEGDTISIGAKLFRLTPGEVPAAAAPKKADKAEAPKTEAPKAETPKAETRKAEAAAPAPSKPKAAPAPAADLQAAGGVTRVKMKPIRKKTAERLKDAQNTAAMLTTFNEIDMSALKAMRAKYNDRVQEQHGIKLGFMSAFCKAVVYGIKDQPSINAFIDGSEIVYHDYVNIAVAVASPKGLVVPVIRNVEKMSFLDVERAIADAGNKARNNQLAIEDLDGGTFTISNGGVFGSLMGTPILNPPQSAILGMHGIFDRPVAVNGQVVIRPMMYVALTYDHRLIDGREAVTFLRKVKEACEDPVVLLL